MSEEIAATIAAQWDDIAVERHRQIEDGLDRSFDEVLAPAILGTLSNVRPLSVLDIGCGSGRLTSLVAERVEKVTAVDASGASIALALRDNYNTNISYFRSSIEEFALSSSKKFDFTYSNMVLMDVHNLDQVLCAVARMSIAGAEFHATLTHPYFWPKYVGYDKSEWYSYSQEAYVELPFRIAAGKLPKKTTHIHRPLELYVRGLYDAGFRDVKIREMAGPEGGDPRFILLSAHLP